MHRKSKETFQNRNGILKKKIPSEFSQSQLLFLDKNSSVMWEFTQRHNSSNFKEMFELLSFEPIEVCLFENLRK